MCPFPPAFPSRSFWLSRRLRALLCVFLLPLHGRFCPFVQFLSLLLTSCRFRAMIALWAHCSVCANVVVSYSVILSAFPFERKTFFSCIFSPFIPRCRFGHGGFLRRARKFGALDTGRVTGLKASGHAPPLSAPLKRRHGAYRAAQCHYSTRHHTPTARIPQPPARVVPQCPFPMPAVEC